MLLFTNHLTPPFLNLVQESKLILSGGGGTPYNGLDREAPPERGTFFRLQGNLSFGYMYLKEPLIKIFRVDAPYDCIVLIYLTLHENDKKTSFQGFRKGMQCS